MGRNPFKDRPEEANNLSMLKVGQRVLIVEKHKQGCDRSGLTDGYITGFLTSKPFHPNGIKTSIIRKSYVDGEQIIYKDENGEWQGDQELIKQIGKVGSKAGPVDLNQYAIGRVQYILENRLNIEQGDLVIISRRKTPQEPSEWSERDITKGVVMDIIQYELVNNIQMTQVELTDGTIGWVQQVISKI